jgi:hypothetical protein
MNQTVTKFEEWAVVEIMGHKRFAGFVTEQAVGGTSFVRIDVPAIELKTGDALPPFTKLFGAASIYCISPCTEETARAFAESIRAEGFARYEAPRLAAPRPAGTMSADDLADELFDDPEKQCRGCRRGIDGSREYCEDCMMDGN